MRTLKGVNGAAQRTLRRLVEEDERRRGRFGGDGEEFGVEEEVAGDRLGGLGAGDRLVALEGLQGVALLGRRVAQGMPLGRPDGAQDKREGVNCKSIPAKGLSQS